MTLANARASLSIGASAASTGDLRATNINLSTITQALNLTNGKGAAQVEQIFADTRQIAASGTDDLDLSGTLEDIEGASLVLTEVKLIYVHAKATNTNNVLVGGAAATQFSAIFGDATDVLVLRPGASVMLMVGAADADGYAVAAGSSDLLRIANSGGGTVVDYDIVIFGNGT